MAVPAPHMQASIRTLDIIDQRVIAPAAAVVESSGHTIDEGYGGSEGGGGRKFIEQHEAFPLKTQSYQAHPLHRGNLWCHIRRQRG